MGSDPLAQMPRGQTTEDAAAVPLPFPVLLRVPRLRPEHERPPLVLPPVERPNRRGKILAGAVIVLALFLMTRWQGWLVTSRPATTPLRVPVRPTEDALTLPPLHPTHPVASVLAPHTVAPLLTRPLMPARPSAPDNPPRQLIIRPGAVHARSDAPLPVRPARPHPIIVSVEPGD